MAVAWRVDRGNWTQDRALLERLQGEVVPISRRLRRLEESRRWRVERLASRLSEHTASAMTDDRLQKIDHNLEQNNLTYNAAAQQFETAMSQPLGSAPFALDWEDVIIALPDLSVNEMLTYQQQKRQQLLREQAEGRSQ